MLKPSWRVTCMVLVVCAVDFAPAQDTQDVHRSAADANSIPEEIRAAADSFVESFKMRDAAAIAAHWTPRGVYINEDGQRFEGRKSIQSEYETLFANSSEEFDLRLEIDSVRFINPQTAIEEGRVALTPQPPRAVRVMSRYTAVHVKQDGKWLMADVRDARVELPPDPGQLDDLGWLVGKWSATNQGVQVEVDYRWIENQHFLASTHTATESGRVTATALEIIGRDPSTGRITSWSFTNDGGHAVGIWAPHGNGWTVESAGVMKDGIPTGAANTLSYRDGNTLLWRSGNRSVGDTLLPDTDEMALKRN